MTRTSLMVLCLALALPAAAGDLYKWQDEEGHWHFSDVPPGDDAEFDTYAVPAEPRNRVTMRQTGTEREPVHVFFNEYHGPAQIELRLAEAVNIASQPELPARFVLQGQEERQLVAFRAADDRYGFRYRLAYTLVPGPPTTELPADLDYYPPFALGERFAISQGIDEATTHTDDANRYAVDIVMPTGTPVLAARGGLVMEVEDDFHGEGRQEESFLKRANVVRVLHDDGSMAVYAHLSPNTARVRPGQRIQAGHWIADSGNSGYSSGPHLHFVVQLNVGMTLESLPFRFRLPTGGVLDPDRRQWLSGVLPMPDRWKETRGLRE